MFHDLISPTSLALLDPFRRALDPQHNGLLRPTASLPAPCVLFDRIDTVACATLVDALPMFRSEMTGAAAVDRLDVVLVRHGPHPEILDPVSIDVVLGRASSVTTHWDTVGYRDVDGGLWLVPATPGGGASIIVRASGLRLSDHRPYRDRDDYADGVGRFARELILAQRRERGA